MALPNVVPATFPNPRLNHLMNMQKLFAAVLVLVICAFAAGARAQSADRVPQSFDPAPSAVLKGFHPHWAVAANDVGAIDPNQAFNNLTLILARSPEQQRAFDQLIEDQQNPKSPEYHHWLTPNEIGARFGVSDHDIASISGWLESQGLHVNSVSNTKVLLSFGGATASLGHAFGVSFHKYKVEGEDRFSISSDPMVPSALAPVILSVRGLSTNPERPQHISHLGHLMKPDLTLGAGDYYVAPADFAKIYDAPSSLTGAGVTIGIVGEARVSSNDISEFESLWSAPMGTITEVVPTAYGGVDPGPAITSEPSCYTAGTCSSAEYDYLNDQGEATLDETRSGSVAPGANILLVTASSSSGGIYDDAEYLTDVTPLPAQVMSISFGACEADYGSDVSDWTTLFSNAAMEGVSVFVSSGDSGAAGCDADGGQPPASPGVASPNYICSPIYETCVGGTEFNDAGDYSAYWSSTNGTGYESALGYIPEGAWNDPGTAPSSLQVSSTGGGVSTVISTPSWQTGTGVPSARAGRYTPDVAFTTSADHDGYVVCLAAIGGNCGDGYFEIFGGTSASAPDMAGVAALLDQSTGAAQGNITPNIYAVAAASPSAFHDVTVTSSGVASCSVSTPSMCNNSIPGHTTLTGGTEGYAVQTGYDEATGWGSLDITKFIQDYEALSSLATPTVSVTPTPNPITFNEALTVNVTVSGSNGTPTGSVKLTSGSYTSSSATLASGAASINVPADSLAVGTDTLTVTYTPNTASSSIYTSASGTGTETVKHIAQTIDFPAITSHPARSTVTLSATASSGLTVSFTSLTTSVCTVSGNSASLLEAGTCTIQASQPGNDDYLAAPRVNQSFTVTHVAQTIDFPAITSHAALSTATLSATASSGLTVSYTSLTTSICTVSGNTASLLEAGTCTIQASQPGNDVYLAAPRVNQNITVTHVAQTIDFPTIASQSALSTVTLSATASSGLTVSFTSLTTSVCTISGNTASLLESGTCTIQASQPGNDVYLAAPRVNQSVTVKHVAQTIDFPAIATQAVNTMVTLSATASSGLTVSYTSLTTSVCTVSGNTASLLETGTCTIQASQPGNDVYLAAPRVNQSFTVVTN
jgi:subtilase family serine protease